MNMQLIREDYPWLTDDEFDDINWQSIEGTCDRCHQVGVKCYHILRLGLHKLNGEACLSQFKCGNAFSFFWREDIKKLLSGSDKALHGQCTSGHFCLHCADIVLECEKEHMTDEFGHYIKDENINFCFTQIRDDILVLHVE